MIELLSIGDHLEAGEYKRHSRFKKALNFRSGDSLIAVVDESIGAGPLNIVVRKACIADINTLTITSGILYIDRYRFPVDTFPLFNSQIDLRETINYNRFFLNSEVLEKLLIEHASQKSLAFLLEGSSCRGTACCAPTISDFNQDAYGISLFEKELLNRFRFGVQAIEMGNILHGVRMIKGLGYGLTPGGDDFIAGMISGLKLAGILLGRDNKAFIDKVYDTARSNSFLSNAFLYCSKEGWYTSKQKALIQSILYGDGLELTDSVEALLTIGETSGADWGVGLVFAIKRAYELLCPIKR
jgi:hypothetical protein